MPRPKQFDPDKILDQAMRTRAERRGQLRAGLELSDRARCLALVVQGCLVNMKALRNASWVHSAARVMLADLRAAS